MMLHLESFEEIEMVVSDKKLNVSLCKAMYCSEIRHGL